MLTQEEKDYLEKLPKDKIVVVNPFDEKAFNTAMNLMVKVLKVFPNANILFMGALALRISGQNDIDLYLLSPREDFKKYINGIKSLFGEPVHIAKSFIEWDIKENEYEIELYISDPNTKSMERQIRVYNILKENRELLEEYERLKLEFNARRYVDYQRAKYEFYNEILK